MGEKKKNWKTTVAGVVAGLGVLLTQLGNFLDGNPETTVDTKVVIGTVVTVCGLLGWSFFTRDKDVSSEGKHVG